MRYQPPSLAAACMILLAAPKLAMSIPAAAAVAQVPEDGGEELEPVPIAPTPPVSLTPIPDTPESMTPIIPTPMSQTPISPPTPPIHYAYQGCYKEPKKGRALDHVWVHQQMTQEMCAQRAEEGDFGYYGVEYGIECWYGHTLRKGSTQAADDDECDKPCPGDPESSCGGGMRLDLWRRTDAHVPVDRAKVGDYDLQGCYVDTLRPRALRRVLGHDQMTPEMCVEFCAGSTYMGLEYGRECWCDNALDITSFKTVLDECQMPCAGDLDSMCGSPNRMDLYKLNSPPAADAPYYAMGCWSDVGAVHRALPELYADDNMSWDMCAGFAARRGFKHFGVEYGRECWAGEQIDSLATPEEGCNFPCAGNEGQMCGGRLRLQMFSFDIADITGDIS